MRQIKSASTVASPRAGLIHGAGGGRALMLALAFPGLELLILLQDSRCSSGCS